MRPGWVARQVARQGSALLALAAVVILVSTFLEVTSAVRQAVRQASVEADLVSGSVQRELARLAGAHPGAALVQLAAAPEVRAALLDALVNAPSVVHVAVDSPADTVVAHTDTSRVGTHASPYPPLPALHTFWQAMHMLSQLRREPPIYARETPLLIGSEPFASVRILIAGTFLWDAVRAAVSHGIIVALFAVAVAATAGLALARVATGRLRLLESGIAALREGRYEARLPESGVDEFARLARELNLLGATFEREMKRVRSTSPSPGTDSQAVLVGGHSRVLSRLGDVAAGVAHELRNQLQVLQFELGALRRASQLGADEISSHAENAARGLENVERAVSGFLKMARVRPIAPAPVRVGDLLRETADEIAEEVRVSGVDLDLEADGGLPETLADREVLKQAMQNVVRNALQALSGRENGRIRLRASRPVTDRLRISITDNGPGIPPEVLPKIFDIRFTTRPGGSGVGLALVRQSVEMHGGDVRIESTPDVGTEVILELPWRAPSGSAV